MSLSELYSVEVSALFGVSVRGDDFRGAGMCFYAIRPRCSGFWPGRNDGNDAPLTPSFGQNQKRPERFALTTASDYEAQ